MPYHRTSLTRFLKDGSISPHRLRATRRSAPSRRLAWRRVSPCRRTSEHHVWKSSAWPSGGADRLAPGQTVGEQVGDGGELLRALLGHEPVRRNEGGIAREQQQVRLDLLVPAIDLIERSAEAPVGLGDPRPPRRIRKRVRGRPVRRAGGEQRALVGEVRVDGVALDAGTLRRSPRSTSARARRSCAVRRSPRRSGAESRPVVPRAS